MLSLLSASKPDNRFLKSGKPNSRGNFLPQTGLPVSKTGKPDSQGTLAGPNRISGSVNSEFRIRAAPWQHSELGIFWIQPASRFVSSGKPILREAFAGTNRNSGSAHPTIRFHCFKLLVTTGIPVSANRKSGFGGYFSLFFLPLHSAFWFSLSH